MSLISTLGSMLSAIPSMVAGMIGVDALADQADLIDALAAEGANGEAAPDEDVAAVDAAQERQELSMAVSAALLRARQARARAEEQKREASVKAALARAKRREAARSTQNILIREEAIAAANAAKRPQKLDSSAASVDASAFIEEVDLDVGSYVELIAATKIQRYARGHITRSTQVNVKSADLRGEEETSTTLPTAESSADSLSCDELADAFTMMASVGHVQAPLEPLERVWEPTLAESEDYEGEWRAHSGDHEQEPPTVNGLSQTTNMMADAHVNGPPTEAAVESVAAARDVNVEVATVPVLQQTESLLDAREQARLEMEYLHEQMENKME